MSLSLRPSLRHPVWIAVLGAAACISSLGSPLDEPAEIEWRDDLEGSRKLAKERGKPLLVVFR